MYKKKLIVHIFTCMYTVCCIIGYNVQCFSDYQNQCLTQHAICKVTSKSSKKYSGVKITISAFKNVGVDL